MSSTWKNVTLWADSSGSDVIEYSETILLSGISHTHIAFNISWFLLYDKLIINKNQNKRQIIGSKEIELSSMRKNQDMEERDKKGQKIGWKSN